MKIFRFFNLYEWYLNKRYRLYTKTSICGVEIQVYWTLRRTQVLKNKIRTNIRNYRPDKEYQKIILNKEIRKALGLRIIKGK